MEQKNKKFHYSWVIMICSGVVLFYSIGLSFNCFTVFLTPLKDLLGLSGAQGSSIVSMMNTGSIIGMLIAIPLYKKVGAREIAFGSALSMGAGAIIYAFAGNLAICYAAAIISGTGFGAGSIIPASILISNWFEKKRGFAMGIASACTGIATIIFSPVFASVIQGHSVRAAFLLDAALILGLGTICFILLRNKPADKGLFPYGHEPGESETVHLEAQGITFKEALHTKNYYIMLVGMLFIGVAVTPLISHMSTIYTTNGYDAMFAAFMVSVYGITMLIFKPLFGFLNDKLGIVRASYIIFGAILGSFIVGLLVMHSIPAFLMAVLIGMGIAPIATVAFPLWIGQVFGTKDMSTIFTSYKIPFYVVGALAAALPGIFFDKTGSYLGVFWVYLVCGVLSFIFIRIVLSRKSY